MGWLEVTGGRSCISPGVMGSDIGVVVWSLTSGFGGDGLVGGAGAGAVFACEGGIGVVGDFVWHVRRDENGEEERRVEQKKGVETDKKVWMFSG